MTVPVEDKGSDEFAEQLSNDNATLAEEDNGHFTREAAPTDQTDRCYADFKGIYFVHFRTLF